MHNPQPNATKGQVTLVGGAASVQNLGIAEDSLIFLTVFTPGGTTGHLSTLIAADAGFSIVSDNVLDTSIVNWVIL